ncbi:hypothetical protein HYT58_02565 [Candidatus Woesearchaeota archaeon]|nr:hypothetical protein [Candidatus Woesearchaeota archaeon]
MAKPIKLFQENTFLILSSMVGGLAAGFGGAIIGGILGLVLDNTINIHNR